MSGIETLFAASAASSAAAGGAAAAGGVAAAAGSTSILGSIATGLSFASGFSSLFSGFQQSQAMKMQGAQEARSLEIQAREDNIEAQQEALRGKQESNDMLDTMIQTIASQNLAFAANGVDPNFGTPVNVADNTRKIANLQMGVTREDAQIRSLARRRQAYARHEQLLNVRSSTRQGASSAIMGGVMKAGGSIGDLIDRRIARG